MRFACLLALAFGFIAGPAPVCAQGVVPSPRPGPVAVPGPIGLAVAREAVRIATLPRRPPPAQAPAAGAGGATVQMRWGELSPLIVGQRVAVLLGDGRTVRGTALAVRDPELLLGADRRSAGSLVVARETVREVTVYRLTGAGGRTAGTIAGIVGGMWLSGALAMGVDSPAAGWAIVLGGTTTLGILGHKAGRAVDTEVTHLTIVP